MLPRNFVLASLNLLLLPLFICLAPSWGHAGFQSYFSPESDLEYVLLDKMTEASQSIDIAAYNFTSRWIRELLLEKLKNEGVRVRLLIHDAETEAKKSFLAPLIAAGAETRWVSEILHHKFIIIDGEALVNSSGNLTSSSTAKKYDENLIYCSSCPAWVEVFQREFDRLMELSNPLDVGHEWDELPEVWQGRPVHYNYADLALFTSSNFVPRFVRDEDAVRFSTVPLAEGYGRVNQAIAQAIREAKDRVLVASGHFRSKPIFDAVVEALADGVHVVIILDGQEYLSPSEAKKQERRLERCLQVALEWECYQRGVFFSRLLAEAGAEVYIKYYSFKWFFPFSQQMHHKYVIIDGSTLLSGSYNWSNNAEFESFENVAIFEATQAPGLLAAFERNFSVLLKYSGGSAALSEFAQELFSDPRQVPKHFDPITLRVDQIDQLRREAQTRCPEIFYLPPSTRYCEITP